jgi:hypothetical protein
MKRRAWEETQVGLRKVTVTTFDGPGDDFLIVIRGKRQTSAPRPKGARKSR